MDISDADTDDMADFDDIDGDDDWQERKEASTLGILGYCPHSVINSWMIDKVRVCMKPLIQPLF